MTVIRLLTIRDLPKPDDETPLVADALRARGADAAIVPWDDPSVDWAALDAAVIRTTWDYDYRRDEFVAWAYATAAVTRLFNPAEIVEWNSHKGYLVDLAGRGVPVVPTWVIRPGEDPTEALGEGPVVVKPAISAGARMTGRFATGTAPETRDLMARIHAERGDALVQPFVPAILESGERSLIFLGGELSHAVNKLGAPGEYRIQEVHGGRVVEHEPKPDEVAVAEAVLRAVGRGLLYARVDMIEGPDGPMLMELEVIEPQLFLGRAPGSAERLAELILAAAR